MYTWNVRKAVIDVGSNSVLLTVAEFRSGTWQTLFESTEVTGLGRDTKVSGLLSPRGIADTLGAVKRAFDKAAIQGCQHVIAAATMAARIATNTDDFLRQAEGQGTPIEVLSGADEAQLGFEAVANDPLFKHHDRISIVDVGGHSTELVTAHQARSSWDILFRKSFSIGALGLRESTLKDDSPDLRATLSAVGEIDGEIGLRYLPHTCGHVVTLGATGTNLVTIRDQMKEWQPDKVHGSVLDYEDVSKSVASLFALDDFGRSQLVGIERGREHTLHAGALILERFLFAVGANDCTVSIRGWRHGLIESGTWHL